MFERLKTVAYAVKVFVGFVLVAILLGLSFVKNFAERCVKRVAHALAHYLD